MLWVIRLSRRLGVTSDEPLAVYTCAKGTYKDKRCYVTNNHVQTMLRNTARLVYKLKKDDPLLSQWCAHSVRVTACNLLHRQGLSDTYIQTRLRWHSNAFLDYLRNTLHTAGAHTKALHIPANNLPVLTGTWKSTMLPSGELVLTNCSSGTPIECKRQYEELERVFFVIDIAARAA
jgi:hypothetical protein